MFQCHKNIKIDTHGRARSTILSKSLLQTQRVALFFEYYIYEIVEKNVKSLIGRATHTYAISLTLQLKWTIRSHKIWKLVLQRSRRSCYQSLDVIPSSEYKFGAKNALYLMTSACVCICLFSSQYIFSLACWANYLTNTRFSEKFVVVKNNQDLCLAATLRLTILNIFARTSFDYKSSKIFRHWLTLSALGLNQIENRLWILPILIFFIKKKR